MRWQFRRLVLAIVLPFLLLAAGNLAVWSQIGPCRITGITPANGKVIIHWTNGSAPYQVQMQTNLMALWENVGGQTTLCCATNTLHGGMGFFRVICGTNPPPPMVIIAAAQPNSSMAGPTNGVFTVARAGSTDTAITVPYTITGTASNGVDYAWLSGSVTLGVGVASASIVVTPTAITWPCPLTGTASNGVDYVALPGSVTLGAGARSANIIVAPIPDTLARPTLKVTLAISAPPRLLLDPR